MNTKEWTELFHNVISMERTKTSGKRPFLVKVEDNGAVNILSVLNYLARDGVRDGKIAQDVVHFGWRTQNFKDALRQFLYKQHYCNFSDRKWQECVKKAFKTVKSRSVEIFYCYFAKCPSFLFGQCKNEYPLDLTIGCFNSRVPRTIPPNEPWLCAFRFALSCIKDIPIVPIVSTGTIPYELTYIWAIDHKKQPIVILPHYYDTTTYPYEENNQLSCCLSPFRCKRRKMMACRDSLVAYLSDIFIVVYLRNKSTLESILAKAAKQYNKTIFIWNPPKGIRRALSDSNSKLRIIPWELPHIASEELPAGNHNQWVQIFVPTDSFPFYEYLYHYTRSTYGPCPHESREHYLRCLLAGDPLVANTALDILIKIARDGVLRPHGGMIRGQVPIISWTSISPYDFERIKSWNAAVLRWTVEKCGIAVRKRVLKELGTKPVCYLHSHYYKRLPEHERYRFQKHEPPKTHWKHEREWRLLGELNISLLSPDNAFWFVASHKDAFTFSATVKTQLPIAVCTTPIEK